MNELQDFNYINSLYEIYKDLLTKKQILVMDKYFVYNLSLSEIASINKVSRSAILDTIESSKKKLEFYEEKLHLYHHNIKIKDILNSNDIDEKIKEEILGVIYNGIWEFTRKIYPYY